MHRISERRGPKKGNNFRSHATMHHMDLEKELQNLVADIRRRQGLAQKRHPILSLVIGKAVATLLHRRDEFSLSMWLYRLESVLQQETGLPRMKICVRESPFLAPMEWALEIRKSEIARRTVVLGKRLVLGTPELLSKFLKLPMEELPEDPAFELPAVWLWPDEAEAAVDSGLLGLHATEVIVHQMGSLIRRNAANLLDRQTVADMLAELRASHPAVVDAVIPSPFSIGDVSAVLKDLLMESVPVADLVLILETMADNAALTTHPEMVLEFVPGDRPLPRSETVKRPFRHIRGTVA